MRRTGYTFRHPNGTIDWRVVHTVEAAQSLAAFAMDLRHTSREFPTDWNEAYRQGFRICAATITASRTRPSWSRYKG